MDISISRDISFSDVKAKFPRNWLGHVLLNHLSHHLNLGGESPHFGACEASISAVLFPTSRGWMGAPENEAFLTYTTNYDSMGIESWGEL